MATDRLASEPADSHAPIGALLHDPPALLLDEPTVTLDDRGAALVERLVARQRERGIVVIATNDPRELRFGDYVLRLGAEEAPPHGD